MEAMGSSPVAWAFLIAFPILMAKEMAPGYAAFFRSLPLTAIGPLAWPPEYVAIPSMISSALCQLSAFSRTRRSPMRW